MVSVLKRPPQIEEDQVLSLYEIAQCKKELFDDGDWIESEHITNDGIRLIQTGNIGIGRFLEKENKKFVFEQSFVKLRCKELRVGDLLICRLAEPAGRACVLPDIGYDRIVTSVDVTIFRPASHVANRSFLSSLFSTADWFRAVSDRSGGTTHKRIARGALGRIKIALPPIDIQNQIAEKLTDADRLIVSLEQLIAKKRLIKQGAMQDLLSGRRRLAGFGGEWHDRRLGDLATLKSGDGITSARIDNSSPYPCFGGNGLRGYTPTYNHDGRYALIGRVGALCGNINIVDGRFFASEHAIVVYPRDGVDTDWLAYLLQHANLNKLSEASAQPVLTVSKLDKLEFNIPINKLEQKAIASCLSDMTANIDEIECRLQKARDIKIGLMQKLLTGRVRLV